MATLWSLQPGNYLIQVQVAEEPLPAAEKKGVENVFESRE